MLSIQLIDKTLQQGDHDRLLRELCRNGLVMPLPLRVRLGGSPTGAAALGLRRLVELTYGPTALSRGLAGQLVAAIVPETTQAAATRELVTQAASGAGTGAVPGPATGGMPGSVPGAVVDGQGQPCPVLTAAVAAGLGRLLRDHGPLLGEGYAPAQEAHRLAIEALARMQGGDGLFAGPADRSPSDRLLGSAFIAYLLLDDHAFAARCQRHALLTALEEQRDGADPATADLIEMARMSGPTPAPAAAAPSHTPAQPVLPALAA